MNLNLGNIEMDALVELALAELTKGGKDLLDELKNGAERKLAQDNMNIIAKETLAMMKTSDPEKVEYHRRNIELSKGTLETLEAAVAIKCYYRTLDIVGSVVGAVAVGVVKALI